VTVPKGAPISGSAGSVEALAEQIAARAGGPVFGVPGGGPSLVLLDRLERLGVPFHLAHFEGAATLMAGTAGRLAGRAGVSVSIKGPGLANQVPGLAACAFEGLPVVAVAEAYPASAPAGRAHKRMDHARLTAAVAKGRRAVSEQGPDFAALAAWAEAERPGPVVLDLPPKPEKDQPPLPPAPQAPTGRIADRVAGARRPVVIAGTLAGRLGLAPLLSRLRVPVFSTAAAKGVVDETLPHAAGVFTGAGGPESPERALLPLADLVVGIGLCPGEVLGAVPFPCPAVNLDSVADPEGEAAFHLAATGADPAELAPLEGAAWGAGEVRAALEAARARLAEGDFLPAHAFAALERRFGAGLRLVVDTGDFCTVAEHVWTARAADRYLGSGQGRYMGTAIPMALGAALHDPATPVAAVLGDGGIGPFVAELKLAAQHRLPLLVLLMSDGGFGSIRHRARADGLTERPLTVHAPSWLEVMAGLGLKSGRADDLGSLARGLAGWQPADGPLYIEATFQPDAYRAMVRGIR